MRATVPPVLASVSTASAPMSSARVSTRWSTAERLRLAWFVALVSAICFEGITRKFIPAIPQAALYFLKDLVLVGGMAFGLKRVVARTVARLYGAALIAAVLALGIITLQLFNPEQGSFPLGLLGLRSYCLWWIAPLVLPSVLNSYRLVTAACHTIVATALVVSAVALYQFSQPADAAINAYAWADQEGDNAVAIVHSTGRARVTSTFSFLTGFNDFAIAVTPFVLACGLSVTGRWTRLLCFATAGLLFFSGFMSGSRSSLVFAVVTVPLTIGFRALWSPRVTPHLIGAAVVGALMVSHFAPDAVQGVLDRFEQNEDETSRRFVTAMGAIPPTAAFLYNFPWEGIGTGMTHTARHAFGVYTSRWATEAESHRVLVELGLVGYACVSIARLGIVAALIRLRRLLRTRGFVGFAGFALALVPMALFSSILIDHVMQALFFTLLGIVLSVGTLSDDAIKEVK